MAPLVSYFYTPSLERTLRSHSYERLGFATRPEDDALRVEGVRLAAGKMK
jgi:hypothetical protein